MDGLNEVSLLGNLGAEPELRMATNGSGILTLSIATTRSWLDSNKQKQEATDWHRVKVWGRRGEGLAKILKKGDRVFVRGSLRYTEWEKDGVKKYGTEIVVSNVVLCGGKGGGGSSSRGRPEEEPEVTFEDEDPIPFDQPEEPKRTAPPAEQSRQAHRHDKLPRGKK